MAYVIKHPKGIGILSMSWRYIPNLKHTCNEFHTCIAEQHFMYQGLQGFSSLEIIMQQLKQGL